MKRALVAAAALASAGVLATTAFAQTVGYYSSPYWEPGMGASSAFSSAWWKSGFSKAYGFDTTVTFIDNTGYNWHATVRGWQTSQHTHWLSSAVKKAHCRSNQYANSSQSSYCYATY